MKQYKLIENRAGKVLFGVFLLAMLLLARDTLVTSSILGFTKSQFLMLGLICILGLTFLVINCRHLKEIILDRRMLAVVVSAVALLLPMLVKRDWQMMYFSILICLFFAVFVTYFTSYKIVAKYYIVILALLSGYSLLATYVLKGFAKAGMLTVPVFYNSNGWDFYNFGLAFVVTWDGWIRNFGIFREPGVYQFFLIIALYLNNYTASWKKQWVMWLFNGVLAIAMLSTFSVVGIIAMGLFVLVLLTEKGWYKTRFCKIAFAFMLVIALVVALYVWYNLSISNLASPFVFEVYDLFIRLTTDSDSAVDRFSAIAMDIALFLKSPLLGDSISTVLHSVNHNTSSTLILYAILGVCGGTLNVLAWIALVWDKERKLWANLGLLVVLFLSFNTQNLIADVFFWLFPYMALVERGLPLLKLPAKKE